VPFGLVSRIPHADGQTRLSCGACSDVVVKDLQPWRSVLIALAAVCAAAPVSHAQTPSPDGARQARIHLGALALDPRLNIRDAGVDTNVFNTATGATRDVTLSVGPELDEWLRAGRVAMAGASSVDWHYFRDSSSQRSLDASQTGAADVDLGYVVPHLSGGFEQTRQRLNLELDARVRRQMVRAAAGVTARLGAKLSIDLAQERRRLEFDDVVYQDVNLADALSRRETQTTVTGRYVATPLTTFVVRASRQADRFLSESERNTDSFAVMPGLELKPLALISGSAFVGFRRFSPRASDLPRFQGVVADVDLSYLVRDLTRLAVGVNRDVDYSYDDVSPYFVSTAFNASVTQALGAGWDVVGRLARARLDYQAPLDAAVPDVAARRDHVNVYGFGVGRRLGTDVRVGIDVDKAHRQSTIAAREYTGTRIGGSVTYGF
jgi:hypothetical protein